MNLPTLTSLVRLQTVRDSTVLANSVLTTEHLRMLSMLLQRFPLRRMVRSCKKQSVLKQHGQSRPMMPLSNGPAIANFGGKIPDCLVAGHVRYQCLSSRGSYHKSPLTINGGCFQKMKCNRYAKNKILRLP
jgi:hypothetical protein